MLHTVSRALWLVAVGLIVAVLGVPTAATAAAAPKYAVTSGYVLAVAPAADPTTESSGPEVNPPATPALADESRNKVIIGVIAVALFAIVYYGRKVRKKRQKDGGGGA